MPASQQVIQAEGTIYMVLEYGDIDLARLLAKHEQARREGGGADELDENFIRLYWQQMLQVFHPSSLTHLISIHPIIHSLVHAFSNNQSTNHMKPKVWPVRVRVAVW